MVVKPLKSPFTDKKESIFGEKSIFKLGEKKAAAASLLVLEHFFMQRLLRTKTIFQNANFAGNNKMAQREKVLTEKVLMGISPDRERRRDGSCGMGSVTGANLSGYPSQFDNDYYAQV